MLNSFQHPSCLTERLAIAGGWTLKQVQGDGKADLSHVLRHRIEDAVDERGRLGGAEPLGQLDGLVDDDLDRRLGEAAQLAHREPQDVAIDPAHPLEPPVARRAGDDLVDRGQLLDAAGHQLGRELVRRLGANAVSACDPSPVFVADCQARFPGVTVKTSYAEALPFDSGQFDATLSQLVIHFMSDPDQATAEMKRVTKSGGCVASSTWDMTGGMELLKFCGEAAAMVDATGGRYNHPQRFGEPGEIAAVFERAGLESVDEQIHTISVPYTDFEEFWGTIEHAAGPVGAFVEGCTPEELSRMRAALFELVGSPNGSFALSAAARSVSGRVP